MSSTLQKRIITAAILAPSLIAAILWLPPMVVSVLLGIIVAIGAWEWSGFVQLDSNIQRYIYSGLLIVCMVLCYWIPLEWIIVIAVLWWICAIYMVVTYPRYTVMGPQNFHIRAMAGFLVLIPAWKTLTVLLELRGSGTYMVLYILILMWVADSGAYFAGRRFGKTKLAPAVSPGKTWEGVIGALVLSAIFTFMYAKWSGAQTFNSSVLILLGMVTVMMSIVGDLLESLFKRQAGIKDSGSIFPGHGGVLDRIDSLTAAAPVYVAGLWLAERLI